MGARALGSPSILSSKAQQDLVYEVALPGLPSPSAFNLICRKDLFEIPSKPHGRISLSNVCLFSKQEV